MGQAISSGNTSVTGSVSVTQTNGLPAATSNQTLLYLQGDVAINDNTTEATVYTVTSGKTFFITRLYLLTPFVKANAWTIKDNATAKFTCPNTTNMPPCWNSTGSTFDTAQNNIPVLSFSHSIRLGYPDPNANVTATYMIVGFEQ